METRVLNNLAVYGSLVMADNVTDFPPNPAVGTFIVKDQCLYGYIKIGGLTTWYPFASKNNSYIHSQGVASTQWIVQHNLGTTNVWSQVKDSQGLIVQALVETVDDNTVRVTFTQAITGTVIVVAPDSINVPEVSTSLINVGNDKVIIDTSGIRIDDQYVLTSGNIEVYAEQAVAAETTARIAADAALQTAVDAKVTANAAIVANTATKITYDTKGLVTAGTSLEATDVPELDASKITTGVLSTARLGTGTADNTTYLRGDGTWQVVEAGGAGGGSIGVTNDTTTNSILYPTFASVTTGDLSSIGVSSTKLTFNPSTGALAATVFNSTSDERKKTDIQTASGNIIQRLRGVEFKWTETGTQSSGVIAQEVEAVIPHAVSTDADGFKSVNYNGLIAYLIEGMKEQQKQIDELKAALNK